MGEANEGPATILWAPEMPNSTVEKPFASREFAPLPMFGFRGSPRFQGLLCPACKLVEFEYS